MTYTRLPMRKIREVLRLKNEQGLSQRDIARSCGVAQSTVGEYIQRADKAGVTWPLPSDLTEAELEIRLFGSPLLTVPTAPRPLPDCEYIYSELRRWRSNPKDQVSDCRVASAQERF